MPMGTQGSLLVGFRMWNVGNRTGVGCKHPLCVLSWPLPLERPLTVKYTAVNSNWHPVGHTCRPCSPRLGPIPAPGCKGMGPHHLKKLQYYPLLAREPRTKRLGAGLPNTQSHVSLSLHKATGDWLSMGLEGLRPLLYIMGDTDPFPPCTRLLWAWCWWPPPLPV